MPVAVPVAVTFMVPRLLSVWLPLPKASMPMALPVPVPVAVAVIIPLLLSVWLPTPLAFMPVA